MKHFAAFMIGLYCAVCAHGHYEQRLVSPMWIQWMFIGKSMIPIIHPAIYRSEYVCDECADNKGAK